MCRIAGIIDPFQPIEGLRSTVAAMCHTLRHGGPDDEGIYFNAEASLVLGHRRLSLLDLSPAGHQPMQSPDGRLVVSYNGEIYNFHELRSELAALGFSFRSGSDTEVILAAYEAWGTASFALFNGMFAFALFDSQNAELFLVRDAAGIKPLYYAARSSFLAFASEVRAFSHLPFLREEHPHWPVYLMAYGHLPEPITTLKDVQPLKKGAFLRYNTATGCHKLETFCHLGYMEKETDRATVLLQLQATLQAAVKRHLLSDAPIGVFLSGGIDSSLMALLAGDVVGRNLNTLSIYFKEAQFSEKLYQDKVLQKLDAVHHPKELSKEDFHYCLPEILDSMDLPSCDGINTWFISRAAKEAGLKAVLSGLGGDELFGGYPSFRRMAMVEQLQALPASVLRSGRWSGKNALQRLAYLSLGGTNGQYLALRGLFTPPAIARHLDLAESEVWQILEEAPGDTDTHFLTSGNKASWLEYNLYMQNQLLRDSDVMSMAHGVEIRVPFLDKEIIRLAFSIASPVKYSGRYGKQLLIDAFGDLLPEDIWKRKKMGFAFPFAQWMGEDEWIKSRMMSGSKAAQKALARFEKRELPWSGLLLTLLIQNHQHATENSFSYA